MSEDDTCVKAINTKPLTILPPSRNSLTKPALKPTARAGMISKIIMKVDKWQILPGTFFQKAATRFKWNEIKIIGRGRLCRVICVTHFSEFKAHLKALYKNIHEMKIYQGLFLKNIGSVRSFWGAVFINLHFGELCEAFKTDECTSRTYLIDVLIGLQLLLVGARKTFCKFFF